MVLALNPMTPEELEPYLSATFDEYIGEQIKAGRTRADAAENAAENRERTFADGVPIGGNTLFTVMDDDQAVGVLWIGPLGGPGEWWIYDIEIAPEYRGRGLGRATMLLAEDAVRERGGTELGLNVFGHNTAARSLYESLGFEPTAIQMRKAL